MGYFSKLPHNEKSCNELAMYVTEMWDTQTLADFAVEVLTERYLADPELFKNDAKAEDEGQGHEVDAMIRDESDAQF